MRPAISIKWKLVARKPGACTSIHPDPGLFGTRVHGPELLSGGAFGVETPTAAMLWTLLVTTILLVAAKRRGRVQPPRFGATD